MASINIGKYSIAIYKRRSQPIDDGPTRVEVIAGENPAHWIIRLKRGRYSWDFKDMKSVIPPTNASALSMAEDACLKLINDQQKSETAIYMLAGMYPTAD